MITIYAQGFALIVGLAFLVGCVAGRVMTIRLAERQVRRQRRASRVARANPRRK